MRAKSHTHVCHTLRYLLTANSMLHSSTGKRYWWEVLEHPDKALGLFCKRGSLHAVTVALVVPQIGLQVLHRIHNLRQHRICICTSIIYICIHVYMYLYVYVYTYIYIHIGI